jgi:HTH-type transcriptional regulator, sugar sensing transcriptional regulator
VTVNDPELVTALVGLGFSLNEARAYSALVEAGASTGYEVALRAHVPRSAVYNALRKLVATGAARSLPGSPERFVATAPASVTGTLRSQFEASAREFEEAAEKLANAPPAIDVFAVRGYERILEEAARVIREAERIVVGSAWPRELAVLGEVVAEAETRGVLVVFFSHAAPPPGLAGVHYSHGLHERDLEAFWRHRLVITADDRRTLVGSTERRPSDVAVVSDAAAIAELATGQIALDITLLAARHRHDASDVLGKILGDRVGNLDALLKKKHTPVLGRGR